MDISRPEPSFEYKGFRYLPEKDDDGDCIKIIHYAQHQYDTHPYRSRTYVLNGSSWKYLTHEEFVEKMKDKLDEKI